MSHTINKTIIMPKNQLLIINTFIMVSKSILFKYLSIIFIFSLLNSSCNLTRFKVKRSIVKNNFNKSDQLKRFLNNMSTDERRKWYIKTYSDFAVQQMKKYKIPASIILSQALLESGAGASTLALKSNNHFGIKCHQEWRGKKVYHDDDEKESVLENIKILSKVTKIIQSF